MKYIIGTFVLLSLVGCGNSTTDVFKKANNSKNGIIVEVTHPPDIAGEYIIRKVRR